MNTQREIIVMPNGFVFVGTRVAVEGKYVVYENAANITQWGTTAGLGELALKGPTSKTKLAPCGIFKPLEHQILFVIPVVSEL